MELAFVEVLFRGQVHKSLNHVINVEMKCIQTVHIINSSLSNFQVSVRPYGCL